MSYIHKKSSLFDRAVVEDFISRINQLTPESRPNWGKMTVGQMLAHCSAALRSAVGEVTLKRAFIGYLFGNIARKQILSQPEFKRDLPTDPHFKVKETKNFDAEKSDLIALIKRFNSRGPEGLSKDPHPFFGNLTVQEWDVLMGKHLDHHLKQFGV